MKATVVLAVLVMLAGICLGCGSGGGGGSDGGRGGGSSGSPPIRVSGFVRLNPAPATLPDNARMTVQLRDISLMDAPSRLLGETKLDSVAAAYSANGAKIPFSVEGVVPTGTPINSNSVAVSASIRGDGVSYITDASYYVNLEPDTFQYSDMEITIIKYP